MQYHDKWKETGVEISGYVKMSFCDKSHLIPAIAHSEDWGETLSPASSLHDEKNEPSTKRNCKMEIFTNIYATNPRSLNHAWQEIETISVVVTGFAFTNWLPCSWAKFFPLTSRFNTYPNNSKMVVLVLNGIIKSPLSSLVQTLSLPSNLHSGLCREQDDGRLVLQSGKMGILVRIFNAIITTPNNQWYAC